MCRCAARGCKRKVYMAGNGTHGGMKAVPGLCYRHGWWYSCSGQSDYGFRCAIQFPVFSVEDIFIWLEWVGL
jgi:hypothetical protein